MSDLRKNHAGMTTRPNGALGTRSRLDRAGRALRGSLFFLVWIPYLLLVAAPVQRLLLWPAITILPSRRVRWMGAWLRSQARVVLFLCRYTAGVRVTVQGTLPEGPIVAVMNHQSVFDIPVALTLFRGTPPLLPTRDRYRRYIPVVSPLLRMARFPFVTQRPEQLEQDLARLSRAAESVALGDHSLLIYAEGHRTRDGHIGRFMRVGPRLILAQAKRPVYTIVADGMAGARTFTDALASLATRRIHVIITGPLAPPTPEHADAFLHELRESMIATLAEIRRAPKS
jgi:1-acyl-sn-glycerol-3-phosphate acyltransferase